MLNPYIKKKFCTSIYKSSKFFDDPYDENSKFSVHLPVEEDSYLQKLDAVRRSTQGFNKKSK